MVKQVDAHSGLRVCVVSYHFDEGFDARPNVARLAFAEMQSVAEVKVVAANFDHIRKLKLDGNTGSMLRVPVRPYSRNISANRLFSYWDFAKQVRNLPALSSADLVYTCVPDNFTAMEILRSRVGAFPKVIIDVVDLWPEAFPLPPIINYIAKRTIGTLLKVRRKRSFDAADLILFQSRYFLEKYGNSRARVGILPMCFRGSAQALATGTAPSLKDEIRILFLGSINSITDSRSIVEILSLLSAARRVHFSVIGGGSGAKWLQERLRAVPVSTNFYGITFDKAIKDNEFSQAHFGFNAYKKTTEVSVSYKSMEYLKHGIPLINCAKGDTFELVQNSGCGVNFDANQIQEVANRLLSLTDAEHAQMRRNTLWVAEEHYSYRRFAQTLTGFVEELAATPAIAAG
jgi:glycosyltransferase involved in cell wall biosynthesis